MVTHNLEDQPETASEVVEDILTNGFSSYDIFTWDTFDSCSQSDLIADIIATIASYEYDEQMTLVENRCERLRLIEDCINNHLIAAAKREGYVDLLMSNDPRD